MRDPEQLPSSAKTRANRENVAINPTTGFTDQQVELLGSLRVLRQTFSEVANLPPFMVFSNQAAYEIIFKLPLDAQHLVSCTSLHSTQRERYDAKIVDIVVQHANRHKLPANNVFASVPGVLGLFDSVEPGTLLLFGEIVNITPHKQRVIDLYSSGKSIDLVSVQLCISVPTVQNYLSDGILSGLVSDLDRLGLSSTSENMILQCLKIMGGNQVLTYRAAEAKSQLPDSISYGEIKLCAAKHYHLWKLSGAPQPPDFTLWPHTLPLELQAPQPSQNYDDLVAKLSEPELAQLEHAISKRRMSLAAASNFAAQSSNTHNLAASSSSHQTVSLELVRPPCLAKPVDFSNITPAPYQLPDESPQLTAEQLQRIEQNRQAALKRRAEVSAAQAAARINSPLSESGNFSQFRSSQEDEYRQSAVRRRIDLNEHMSPARNVNTSVNQSINLMSPLSMPPLEASQNQLQQSPQSALKNRLDLAVSPKSSQTTAPQLSSPTSTTVLTAEQLQRIEQNRLAALKRRAEVLAASATKKSA